MRFDRLPIGQWGESLFDIIVAYIKWPFDLFVLTTGATNDVIEWILLDPPSYIVILLLLVICWWTVSFRFAIAILLGLLLLLNQGLWQATMTTLALVLTATLFSMLVALPLGIILGTSAVARKLVFPVLDFIQTMPRFVYLIPAVILLGIDVAPAVFATMTLAIPAPARLIAIGIMEVDEEIVEAGNALGCSGWQILFKIQLPLSVPSILLGLNQCVMMALSMTVIASLIGAGGLGTDILTAISSLDAGQGVVAGFGIFILAVLLDRSTQGLARKYFTHLQSQEAA